MGVDDRAFNLMTRKDGGISNENDLIDYLIDDGFLAASHDFNDVNAEQEAWDNAMRLMANAKNTYSLDDAAKIEEINQLQQAKERGYSAQQVDNLLKSKGSSLIEALGVIQYGAENVARGRLAGQIEKERQENERPWHQKAVNDVADFFGKNKLGRAILSTLQGANKENPLVQIASLAPGMDWVNDDLIIPETATERALDMGGNLPHQPEFLQKPPVP